MASDPLFPPLIQVDVQYLYTVIQHLCGCDQMMHGFISLLFESYAKTS